MEDSMDTSAKMTKSHSSVIKITLPFDKSFSPNIISFQ